MSGTNIAEVIGAVAIARRLLWQQRLDRAGIERLQDAGLRRLIRGARTHVPYYRRLLDEAGVGPDDVRGIGDLHRIPITSKDDIRDLDSSELVADGADLTACRVKATSGSSGVPLRIYWDRHQHLVFAAAYLRSHVLLRCRLRDRFLVIGPTYYPEGLLPQRLGLCRLVRVSPFVGPAAHLRALDAVRPDVLECYPSVLRGLLDHVETQGWDEVHRPRLLTTSGEYLDRETHDRAHALFGTPPTQFYGAWEVGRIGNECLERSGLHLTEDLLIAELMPTGRPHDPPGAHRLVLTNLHNHTMPFIRYEIGDLVEPIEGGDRCACGAAFRRIRMLSARDSEVVRMPDGTTRSALHLTAMILGLPGIRQFRITQEAGGTLVVEVVAGAGYCRESAGSAQRRIESLLPGVETAWRLVETIARDASGKQRRFIAAEQSAS